MMMVMMMMRMMVMRMMVMRMMMMTIYASVASKAPGPFEARLIHVPATDHPAGSKRPIFFTPERTGPAAGRGGASEHLGHGFV
jgi:hypothetical protein